MLEIEHLTGGWRATTVIQELSLTVRAGETVSIVGRNGVGKSTLLELLVGRARLTAGHARLGGQDLLTIRTPQRAALGLGYVPQQREVFRNLTVRENLRVARRPGLWDEAALFELFPSLEQRKSSLGRELSGGEQQMLSIARALIGNPRVLLMDEPSEGLAPVVIEKLMESLQSVSAAGNIAVLMVEQRVDIAIALSSRCLVMDRGRVVNESRSEDLRQNPSRIAALMGLGDAH